MAEAAVLPELKQILGAMIFAADRSLSIKEMRSCLKAVAELHAGETSAFGKAKEDDIQAALAELQKELGEHKIGFFLGEVAGGFRFQSDPSCGKWLRQLLEAGSGRRLSWPALETLAIIAYRQPMTRAEIEGVRGVNVDHMMRTLLEMQLIKIVGRSDLPGKPFAYGTTQVFLEYFGLRDLDELSKMNPMLLRRDEKVTPKVKQVEWTVDKYGQMQPGATGGAEPAAQKEPEGAEAATTALADGAPAEPDGASPAPAAGDGTDNPAEEAAGEDAEEELEEDEDDEFDEDDDEDEDEDQDKDENTPDGKPPAG